MSISLRRSGYLRKWLVLGFVIGAVAGLGAVVFSTLLEWCTRFFLGFLAGAEPLTPAGEGHFLGQYHVARPWALPLVVGLGGLISGILVSRFATEAEGDGTEAAISAIHSNPKGIRARVSLVKIVASAATIGAGGSAGREGPTSQISAGFASLMSRLMDLTPADARIAVTVGVGSGLGSIFKAPLGGAVLGAEILYLHDAEIEALIPSVIASITGFVIYGAFKGFTPIFGFLHDYRFSRPATLLFFAVLGVAAGLVGRLYSSSFYRSVRLFKRLPGSRVLKPAVAGVMVGLIGLVFPGALGTGYGWVQKAMGPGLLTIPVWIVLLLPFAKILATSLSIGSGGSGGVFGPGMVIGGFLGAGLWRVLEPIAPALVPHSPAPFIIVGMIACFGSIAHAPLAVMLMVAEMTGTLALLAPAMVAVALATLVVGEKTIYENQLPDRTYAPSQRFKFGLPLLATIGVRDAMTRPGVVLGPDTEGEVAATQLGAAGMHGAPVVDSDDLYLGWFKLPDNDGHRNVGSYVDVTVPAVPDDATLDSVVDVFANSRVAEVPILGPQGDLVGVVGIEDAMTAYRRALGRGLRRLGGTMRAAEMVDVVVGDSSGLVGATVADLPEGAVVVSIERSGHLILPHDDTDLESGDNISLIVTGPDVEGVTELVRGGPEPEADESAGPSMV